MEMFALRVRSAISRYDVVSRIEASIFGENCLVGEHYSSHFLAADVFSDLGAAYLTNRFLLFFTMLDVDFAVTSFAQILRV